MRIVRCLKIASSKAIRETFWFSVAFIMLWTIWFWLPLAALHDSLIDCWEESKESPDA